MMDDFNDSVDAQLVSRMRAVNPEQFHTIVKMHLSFELDINTEEFAEDFVHVRFRDLFLRRFIGWQRKLSNDCTIEKAKLKKWGILCFSKKPKSTMNLQKGMESSAALTEEGINQMKHLIDYLSQEQCITQEGIFRRTGALTRQQELKTSLYQGSPLNLDEAQYNVHDCASVLKSYLAELPEPLLTDLHYPAHCQIAELCSSELTASKQRLLRVLQLLLLMLPIANRVLLKHIIQLLNKTASYESSNKMNCDTLATLFTPHLMCPRKLSPEALHVNSQNLSGLVAFMIRKGSELFDIPEKLGVEVRAYWTNQERKMMSPNKNDTNESTSDATGTAHTVFSFVDHKLTAAANAKEDTQVALAQLYATIQAMPESTKKRRLIKQLNKESMQMTPRSSGKACITKSLGDSIKKHIFQKKLLGNNKKINDLKTNENGLSRSSSEENVFTTNLNKLHASSQCSKSVDELDAHDSFEDCNLLTVKPLSSSTGSIDTPVLGKTKVMLKRFVRIDGSPSKSSSRETTPKKHQSQPLRGRNLVDEVEPVISCFSNSLSDVERMARANFVRENEIALRDVELTDEVTSPTVTHTSTPSDLLRRAIIPSEHHMFTPISKDKSMSPITQSATKMPKAMQETMMTPRSRNPIMMVSGSNICDLASSTSKSKFYTRKTCQSIVEEKSYLTDSYENLVDIKENLLTSGNYLHSTLDYGPKSREYALSRSVLTASPVDLSFSSRTDDYEQSESESKAESDTSGVVSGGSGSPNDSPDRAVPPPRKRSTSLQRNDSKIMAKSKCKQLSESNLKTKIKDGHVTSF